MFVKDMPTGAILWFKLVVVGVKGCTLDYSYEYYKCSKIDGNRFDYELDADSLPDNVLHILMMQNQMIVDDLMNEEIEVDKNETI